MTPDLYAAIRDEELATLRASAPDDRLAEAAGLLDALVLGTASTSS